MGDAGEGLVDADAKIQERLEEVEAARRERARGPVANPEEVQKRRSLELAKASLKQQLAAATHPVRQQQLQNAIADIDRQLV